MRDTLQALVIYGMTFLMAYVCFFVASRYKRKKVFFFLFSLLGLFVLCFVAAIRKETVGTDVLVYVKPIFLRVSNFTSFYDVFNYQGGVEVGFILLAYLSFRLVKKLSFFLFIIELMQIVPIYFFAIKKCKDVKLEILMSVYMFLFYNASFNIMRQGIAAGFILLAYVYFEEKKYIQFIVLTFVGYIFHNSSIIAMVIVMISVILFTKRNKNLPWGKLLIIGSIITVLLNFLISIGYFFVENGILSTKYLRYLQIFESEGASAYFFEMNFYFTTEVLFWILITVVCIYICDKDKKFSVWGVYLYSLFIAMVLYVMGVLLFNTSYLYRIGWINMYFCLPILSDIEVNAGIQNWRIKKKSLIICGLLMLYLFFTCFFGWHGTRPLELLL